MVSTAKAQSAGKEVELQHILSVWLSLDPRRRIVAMGSGLIIFAAVLGMLRFALTPSMSLLYSGLEAGSAGEVVQSLEQSGVDYEIRQGSIFVDSSRRDQLRMTLAAAGLPATSGQGYELLDGLSGFGTTSQMFDAAYWRAKEGELARTIQSNPQITSARVHIANPRKQGFRRSEKSTASVTITASGGAFSPTHAKALRYLVSSAVPNMQPDDVAIIDGRNGLVVVGDEQEIGSSSSDDKAAELKSQVERMLEARVGPGKAVVEISIETETETESIVERRFDPEGRVAISTDTEEKSTTSSDARSNAVTVASNLPDGDAGADGNNSSSQGNETRERVNYEISETTRELLRQPGAVRRISVAVLLDGIRSENPTTGELEWAPRPQEEMAALLALVESAVGFDAERGDSITLKSLEFEPLDQTGSAANPSLLSKLDLDIMQLIQLGVLALVSLVLALFVFKPIFSVAPVASLPDLSNPNPATPLMASTDGNSNTSLPATLRATDALTGEIDDGSTANPTLQTARNGNIGHLALAGTAQPTDPVHRLRQMISDREHETVEVLRTWIDDQEEIA